MNRWVRLIGSVIAMAMIANLQYAWALFVKPMMGATGWKLSDVQWGFTIFIALETCVQPFTGRYMDKLGPRVFMSVGAVMCGVGWVGMGRAHTLSTLYFLYGLAGVGAALVYCGSTIVGLKWFPDKLGLASGLIAAGFGSGAALFVPYISYIIRTQNYRSAFLYTGIGQGIIILLVSQLMVNPDPNDPQIAGKKAGSKYKVRAQAEQFTSSEMLGTYQFYMLYAMMLMMGIGGLMVTAQLGSVADTLGIAKAVFTLAIFVNSLANGAGRIFWGWVSDHLGRERTMIVAFLIQALALVTVLRLGRNSPFWFVALLAIVLFTWGEIYSLFPATMADFFGIKNSGSNYAFLYSSKGVASILAGGLAALLFEKMGSWTVVFYGSAILAFITSIMAALLIAVPQPTKLKAAPVAVPAKSLEP
ncbi:MAG TPA: oxalate/formate MFS antiporter [Candidatus Acidoferrales bacterium]|nr:oxalate/formate MFS antiporter [Candidatus Acidoferrales bacterium]